MSESADADKTQLGSRSEFNRHHWVRIPLPAPTTLSRGLFLRLASIIGLPFCVHKL